MDGPEEEAVPEPPTTARVHIPAEPVPVPEVPVIQADTVAPAAPEAAARLAAAAPMEAVHLAVVDHMEAVHHAVADHMEAEAVLTVAAEAAAVAAVEAAADRYDLFV